MIPLYIYLYIYNIYKGRKEKKRKKNKGSLEMDDSRARTEKEHKLRKYSRARKSKNVPRMVRIDQQNKEDSTKLVPLAKLGKA